MGLWGGGVVAHKILVSAPVPLELILTGLGLGLGDLGFGTGLDNYSTATCNYTEDFNAIIFTPRSLWENCYQIRAQIQSFNLGINQSPDPVTK